MNQHTPNITCRGVACNALAPTERDARIVSNVVAVHDLGVARNAPTRISSKRYDNRRMNKYNPDVHHRRSVRLYGYDYSEEGLYFVTICVNERNHCLVRLLMVK